MYGTAGGASARVAADRAYAHLCIDVTISAARGQFRSTEVEEVMNEFERRDKAAFRRQPENL
jgi:hypothetical protein